MRNKTIVWILAIIITLAAAVYQRLTGPTYPVRGKVAIAEKTIKYRLHRSHSGNDDHRVEIAVPDTSVSGLLIYKRYKTLDPWRIVPMKREDGKLIAYLPGQPPAGKLMYRINLRTDQELKTIPSGPPVIIRFKGRVPSWILIPHIFLMFFAMLFSNRTGLAALFDTKENYKKLVWITTILLFCGGMILGAIVQKYAFGAFWTGIPFGYDLTDNKTLIALIGWLIALVAVHKSSRPRWYILGASILLLLVYLIPHSVMGSELDYSKLPE